MQRRPTEPIKLEGAPAMSRAGNVFTLFAWVWMVVGPVVVYSILGLIDIVERPLSVRLAGFTVILVVGFGPFVVVLLMTSFHGRRLASLRPFRWLLATTQPGASLDPAGSKRWWSRPLTLAEYVVVMRPDQFALLDTHPGWPHYWFRPVQASTDRGQATGAI